MLMVPLQIESLGMEDEIQCITSFSTSEAHHGHALGISLPSQFFWLCLWAGFCFISLNDFYHLPPDYNSALLFSSLSLNVIQTHPQVPKQQTGVNIL